MAWYEVDSLTIHAGSIAWGDLTRTHTDNGVKLGLNEVAEEPGFDYEFVFESIPGTVDNFRFKMNGYYDGNVAHVVKAYAYNYHFGSWSELGTIAKAASDQTYEWASLDADDWSDSGQAKIRIIHETFGTVGHYLRIDQLVIEELPLTTAVPTTAPPTVVPTTLATTPAPTSPIPPTTPVPTTTAVPTTPVPTTLFTTAPPTTPFPYDPDKDVWFNCYGNNYAGVLIIEITITGHSLSASYGLDELELSIPITITGTVPKSALYSLDDLELSIEISITGWAVANELRANWVGWSKIGEANFALDLVNDAGFRPMSWKGFVYRVEKLNSNVVIYGSEGVTAAFPVSSPAPTFGFREVLNIGVKNKTAMAGDEFVHFFIDVLGCLYMITPKAGQFGSIYENLEKLGYEEFLLPLVNPVLTWDASEQRLHISDANTGYIFTEGSLGGGYANLTGLYRIKDDLTAVSPGTVVAEPVEICTDIIDFKRRGLKSIENIETDAISDVPLIGAIDYRYKKTEEFKTSDWSPLNNEGVLHLRAAGTEFRFRLKGLDHGTFDLSYMLIHFKLIDQRFTRDPREPVDAY